LGKIRKRITDIPWMIARLKSFLSRFPWLKKYLLVLRNDYLLRLSASESISPWYETVCSDKVQIASCNPSAKRLIYISPLPPVHSGIADYSMRLLSALAEHYELVVVVENTSEVDPLTCRATLMSAAQYRESGFPLDPHIYHFGNSHHHLWMLPLLERFGGIVMLHDLFLGGLYHSLARQNHIPIEKLLFDNHGYEALIYYDKHGLHETLLQYPMNRNLLAYADAIVVHSEFSYTRLDTPCRYKVPFPKELPILSMSRFEAKKACGFSDSDFVICTFGFIGSSKCAKELLLAWRESMLSTDISAHLVFVGELPQNEYADQLLSLAVALPNPSQVVFTGYVDSKQYAQYMMASDVVVQLRKDSRGETSAAAFDALSYGRALLVNANATLAELPSDVLVRIPDRFIVSDLSIALEEMRRSGTLREKIEKSARQYVQMYHNPALVAQRYRDVIDEAHQKGLFAPYRKALCIDADTSTLIRLRTPFTPPTIFVDISDVAHHDLRTGIQRVVRSILKYLMTSDAPYRISPVRMVEGSYCHAHRFMWKWLGFSTHSIEESPAMMREGDVFLGLDLYVGHIAQNPPLFRRMKEQGVAIHFIVYDILPLRFPHFFPPETHPQFLGWLKLIAEVSTSLCCISRSVADEVRDWLDAHPVSRADVLRIESFPLGADIESSTPSVGITEEQHAMLEAITSGQIVLMVGTIEPRKGHAQAIEAFERLWEQGSESALVIVGKGGWMMDDVLGTLRFHSERNRRLFWFEGASDELLNTLYRRSSLLLAASYGEGFGLPLIEASRHAIPLLVRDIPVFREVASDYATYFHADTSDELASALREWFEQPCEAGVPLLFTTWEQSAQTLLERIFEEG
jgi:glycosyltransferase involved in cell wall biosynthesis